MALRHTPPFLKSGILLSSLYVSNPTLEFWFHNKVEKKNLHIAIINPTLIPCDLITKGNLKNKGIQTHLNIQESKS